MSGKETDIVNESDETMARTLMAGPSGVADNASPEGTNLSPGSEPDVNKEFSRHVLRG